MKYIINKLSVLIMMLMCVSAAALAEIVHHTPCTPTLTTRGFTRECWEDTETGKIYANANLTQEIVNEELAKVVIYSKLPKSPVKSLNGFEYPEDISFRGVNMNYSVSTSFQSTAPNKIDRSAEFIVTGDNVANARLVWSSSENYFVENYISVSIYVNNEAKGRVELRGSTVWENYVFVQSLSGLNKGDVVRFNVWSVNSPPITIRACLEYIGTFDNNSPIAYHTIQRLTESTLGFTRECWENKTTGKYYADTDCTQELKDLELAKTVIYPKQPESPIVATNGFDQSESETDWDVDLNWAGVTTYSDNSPESRWVKFKPSSTKTHHRVANARLVWNKNNGDRKSGEYRIQVYVNDVVQYSKDQKYNEFLEGVFVLLLPNLKKDDIVRFEVQLIGDKYSTYSGATFKASLEYNVIPCTTHEYPTGSAICRLCDYIKAHDHTYHETEICSQCGHIDPTYTVMTGAVGKNNINDIKWVLNRYNVITYTGTGEMEDFNAEHNAWQNDYRNVIKKVVIGEGITKIGDGDNTSAYFDTMKNLAEVSLPSTLKVIGSFAFAKESTKLTSITLPEGLNTIGVEAFSRSFLKNVVIPASVTSIETLAFYFCEIKSLTLKGAPTIASDAFEYNNLTDVYLMSDNEVSAAVTAFGPYYRVRQATLHIKRNLRDWSKSTYPWMYFGSIQSLFVEYTDSENNIQRKYFDEEASDNTITLADDWKRLTIYEDVPMQTLNYTRNFSAANQWQALYVPFEMEYSDWADKFDVATISNFHEYTNENGETETLELEVRNVKAGKLRANTPYLIRAKEAGEQTITLNNTVLKAREIKSVDCSSTERRYTFTGTYDAISRLKTNGYIFISGGRLCKANNDTDVLKPMRWYLTIEDYFSMTSNSSRALAKPMSIRLIDEDEATGIEQIENGELKIEDSLPTEIYNLNGMRLSKLQKGINIVNGKKIIVRQ